MINTVAISRWPGTLNHITEDFERFSAILLCTVHLQITLEMRDNLVMKREALHLLLC